MVSVNSGIAIWAIEVVNGRFRVIIGVHGLIDLIDIVVVIKVHPLAYFFLWLLKSSWLYFYWVVFLLYRSGRGRR